MLSDEAIEANAAAGFFNDQLTPMGLRTHASHLAAAAAECCTLKLLLV
jgi:hypothetical protein